MAGYDVHIRLYEYLIRHLPMNKTKAPRTDAYYIEKAQERIKSAVKRLGSGRNFARQIQLNHYYVSQFLNHGTIPNNKEYRRKLGLPKILPSERKIRVRKVPPLLGSPGWEDVFFKPLRPR
jgi:hypothetical protein